mgnify:CR=1 FL=1
MKHFSTQDFAILDKQYRAKLINSLSGFKSANLVGTQDALGITNLSMVSSVFHIGADPALVGMIMRPDELPRDTLANIKNNGFYTINHVGLDIFQQAHQASARYNAQESEFEKVGLTPEYHQGVSAPFVAESQLKFAVAMREIIPLSINNTILVIGEICHLYCMPDAIKADGYIDIESLETVTVSGLDCYHITRRLARLSYAKPDKELHCLTLDGEGS